MTDEEVAKILQGDGRGVLHPEDRWPAIEPRIAADPRIMIDNRRSSNPLLMSHALYCCLLYVCLTGRDDVWFVLPKLLAVKQLSVWARSIRADTSFHLPCLQRLLIVSDDSDLVVLVNTFLRCAPGLTSVTLDASLVSTRNPSVYARLAPALQVLKQRVPCVQFSTSCMSEKVAMPLEDRDWIRLMQSRPMF